MAKPKLIKTKLKDKIEGNKFGNFINVPTKLGRTKPTKVF